MNLAELHQLGARMAKHRKAVDNIKPVLNTKIKPRAAIPKPSKMTKGQFFQTYHNVLHTFDAINKQKTVIDRKPPKSCAKKVNSGPSRQQKYQLQQHQRRINSTNKKIAQGTRWVDRKKNVNDPVANPVYFIKRAEELKGVSIDPLVKQFVRRPSCAVPFQADPSRKKKQQKPKKQATSKSQTQIRIQALSKQVQGLKQTSRVDLKERVSKQQTQFMEWQVPQVKYSTQEAYTELKAKVWNYVLQNKIYKEKDFKILFLRVVQHNPQLQEQSIQQLVNQVKIQLQSYY